MYNIIDSGLTWLANTICSLPSKETDTFLAYIESKLAADTLLNSLITSTNESILDTSVFSMILATSEAKDSSAAVALLISAAN